MILQWLEEAARDYFVAKGNNSSTLNVRRVIALSDLYDLALLETEQSVPNHLKLRVKMPKSAERLVLLGYPKGVFKKMKTKGNISSHENVHFYQDEIF